MMREMKSKVVYSLKYNVTNVIYSFLFRKRLTPQVPYICTFISNFLALCLAWHLE